MINYNVSKIISKLGEREISAELHSGFLHSIFFSKFWRTGKS